MKYTDNALNILAVKELKGIARGFINEHLKGNESIEEIVSIINEKKSKITIEDFEICKKQILEKIKPFSDAYDGLIAIGDKKFPPHRSNVNVKKSEMPIFLFYKGNLELLNLENNNATVIGLLNPNDNIIEREKKMVAELVNKKMTIVSGLALGCDSIAHIQALERGKTIAILPSPIHNILPARNKKLAFDIVENGGLLISEYYDNFKTPNELTSRYVERDRLQALYCDVIILVASYAENSANLWPELKNNKKLDSGARLAMRYAKNYGIPRLVMYNEVEDSKDPMFDLNRYLLEDDRTVEIISKKKIEQIVNKITNNKSNFFSAP